MTHSHPKDFQHERTFGQRAADTVADFAGSWSFIFLYCALTAAWIALNITIWHFDPYPFILYTMCVSVLAILMASLILLATKRQSQIDRDHAENAYHQIQEIRELLHNLLDPTPPTRLLERWDKES